jgi:hypothetical protein
MKYKYRIVKLYRKNGNINYRVEYKEDSIFSFLISWDYRLFESIFDTCALAQADIDKRLRKYKELEDCRTVKSEIITNCK